MHEAALQRAGLQVEAQRGLGKGVVPHWPTSRSQMHCFPSAEQDWSHLPSSTANGLVTCFYPTFQSFIEVFLLQGSSSQSCLVGVYAHTSAKGDIRESWPHSWKVAESGLKCKFIPEESKLGPDSDQGALAQWPGRRKGYCGSALWVPTRDELNKKETSQAGSGVFQQSSRLVFCLFFL